MNRASAPEVMTRSKQSVASTLERIYPVAMSENAIGDIVRSRSAPGSERPRSRRLAGQAGSQRLRRLSRSRLGPRDGPLDVGHRGFRLGTATDWELLEPRDYLVRAGALIVIALERLDRDS